jgi:putative ATP-binding cassette transporter
MSLLLNNKKFSEIWKLIVPYWRSQDKYIAWSLFGFLVITSLGMVYGTVVLNQWSNNFYTALQAMDKKAFISSCLKFTVVVAGMLTCFVLNQYLKRLLSFRWRTWLTKEYLNRWLENTAHYRFSLHKEKTDNPEQRISQDLSDFTVSTIMISFSVFVEVIKVISFVIILWGLSKTLHIPLGDKSLYIPGYMVWAAFIYALIGNIIVFKIGKPIVKLDYDQEKLEANFRYHLIRLRERGEEVAIYRGEPFESISFQNCYKEISDNFRKIINRAALINAWKNIYGNASTIFPFIAAAPMFFSGGITLGVLMQINGAFREVKDSLSVLIENYQEIARLTASVNRILEFSRVMMDIESTLQIPPKNTVAVTSNFHNSLVFQNLTLRTPEGKDLIKNFNLSVNAGETVLLMGPSGLGKSTLLRAISGIWPFGEGTIHLPAHSTIFIAPQKPYMPRGSLREGLLYPSVLKPIEDKYLIELLSSFGLKYLENSLHEIKEWDLQLSIGEQQRIIFIRALIQKSDWIIMDEPTSAMDKENETNAYQMLNEYLPNSTVITIGHSPSLKAFHKRVLNVNAHEIWDPQPDDLSIIPLGE